MLDQLAEFFTKVIKFTNSDLEGPFEGTIVNFGLLYREALKIEGLNDEETTQVAVGVMRLASLYAVTLPDMSEEQRTEAKAAIAEIVTGANQELVENLFNLAVDSIAWGKQVNDTVNSLIAAATPAEGQ